MTLQRIEISALWFSTHGGHGPIKPGCRLGLVEPEFIVRDGLGGLDHPDPGFGAVDQHSATSKLLAERKLPAGADLLDDRARGIHADAGFMPSC